MAKKLPRCDACGRAFRPNRYNKHDQIYCLTPECVLERKRKRQRRFYNNRYRNDSEFRESERTRAAEGNRRRRAAAKAEKPACEGSGGNSGGMDIHYLITGFVSHLAQSDDPAIIGSLMSGYTDRGRRLAAVPGERDRSG